ncbi:hypothetical protein EDB19DRAFT_1834402 [Suillus lakei]|nr:hypothetical protein EDB19DRAFT_1834402 [Suillus lakei]
MAPTITQRPLVDFTLHTYIKFNEVLTSQDERMITHEEFVEAALEDVFDAYLSQLCMQDHLDGGISLLIRCPGSQARDSLTPERIAVNVYVTPRELHEHPEQVGGDVSLFVQGFCEQIAKNHLQHFTERCRIEGIQPPHHYPAPQVDPTGSQALPAPLVLTSSHIQCSAHPPHILHHNFETRAIEKKGSSDTLSRPQSSFIQHTTALASAALPGSAKLRQRRHANAFSLPKNVQLGNTLTPFTVDGPIISIGPSTDAVLDRFKMGDELIPKLRELMSTGRKNAITVMSSQTFYTLSVHSRRIQPAPRRRAKVQLSKEA